MDSRYLHSVVRTKEGIRLVHEIWPILSLSRLFSGHLSKGLKEEGNWGIEGGPKHAIRLDGFHHLITPTWWFFESSFPGNAV